MAALKSLEREFPLLDCDFQSFCASHGIHTVSDFLLHDLNLLAASAGDHPRLNEGIEQVLSIVDALHHQPWLDGEEMLRDALNNKRVLSTGLLGLDSFLNGGLRIGQLTELVGQSSSGKTQFCLRIASSVAKMDKSNVVYIDTGNSFSSKLIEQFVRESCDSAFDQDRISVVQRESREDREVRLLVIDSISSLITPVLGGSSSQGHGLMASLGVLLKKLAHEYNIAILVTNHMVGGEGGSLKPALGESWKSIPHVRLLLSRDHRTNACNISTLKHPSLASGGSAIFTIE
ncbi:DNA repair protein RAD51 homolog 4 [Linum perenne]